MVDLDGLNIFCRREKNDTRLPEKAHKKDTGFDLCSDTNIWIAQYEYCAITTGLIVKPPEGYYFEVFPRSSLFKKKGLILVNSVGVIDEGFCGKNDIVHLLFYKLTEGSVSITRGERLAQLVLRKRIDAEIVDITDRPFEEESRSGIGSSGGYKDEH